MSVQNLSRSRVLGILFVNALSVSCATLPAVGDLAAKDPPRLVDSGQRDENTGKRMLSWDKPSAFGKLSELQKALGDAACMMARAEYEALGYHARAQDLAGNEMKGGGYFCVPKANAGRADPVPPRLVTTNGVLGWDRPGAFGVIDPRDQARGDQICERAQTGTRAYGFHPNAQDAQGKALVGGGFFCAPSGRS